MKNTYGGTSDRPVPVRLCSYPSCGQAGNYPAPKSRDRLDEHYFFCLEHVRAYNKAWDYFSGLSTNEIEAYIRRATVWERPSWPLAGSMQDQHIRRKALHDIFEGPRPARQAEKSPPLPSAERDALAVLELSFPVDFAAIKGQYRALVKKHHPDVHGGDPEHEEKFKTINRAFATLRRFFKKA